MWLAFHAFWLYLIGWLVGWLWLPRPLIEADYSTLLYSAEEELLGARIAPDGQWRFPPADSVPAKFATCLITFEDKRFYDHAGVDLWALARACRQNLQQQRVVSGGSTLTMQLARISRGNQSRTIWQKGLELGWALCLEAHYSKEELLRLYASHAPFGGNVVGVEAAAWRYFGRPAVELSWAESALLAVLPNAPSLMHPGRNREQLQAKRDRLLAALRNAGVLSAEDYALACLEPLPDKPVPLPNEAPHLMETLAAQRPGTRLSATLQAPLQRQATAIVNRYAREYRSNHIYNVAALMADVETGEVLAYVGNTTDLLDSRRGAQVDVIQAPRSTGSLLKPFLYAGLLQDGALLPGTLVPDIPLNIQGFRPQNYHKQFQGAVPAHVAIERSLNVPLVRMLTQYNTGRFMQLLKDLGMTTLRFNEDHYGASLILGGAEGTLWDLTGMYGSLARQLNHYRLYNGRYDRADIHPLRCFVEERSADEPSSVSMLHQPSTANEASLSDTQRVERSLSPIRSLQDSRLSDRAPLSYASIWFAFEAMSALNRPEEEADWQQFESMKRIAWKTGTSYGGRDAWAIGVTPRYVVGVWAGNASGEGRPGLTGVGTAAPVLFDLFSLLPEAGWFEIPYDELERLPICRRSGHRATALCEPVDTIYVPRSGLSTPPCPYHKRIHLSADGQYRVNSSCESVERMQTCSWFVLPPAMEYYYRQTQLNYRALPPWKPGCVPVREPLVELIYPEPGAILHLPKGLSGQSEQFVFKAAHARPDALLYWHLDDNYLGTTSFRHEMACIVGIGKHQLTVVDQTGNQQQVRFEVK